MKTDIRRPEIDLDTLDHNSSKAPSNPTPQKSPKLTHHKSSWRVFFTSVGLLGLIWLIAQFLPCLGLIFVPVLIAFYVALQKR